LRRWNAESRSERRPIDRRMPYSDLTPRRRRPTATEDAEDRRLALSHTRQSLRPPGGPRRRIDIDPHSAVEFQTV